ncbi:MAG: branched-chain amino acid ABC transporter substrate-binding protein [Acidimicrobiia bacterium]
MRKRWLVLASLLMAFALVATACGDDDATTTTAAPATTTTAGATTTSPPTTTPPPETAFDIGVTPAPCPDAENEGNGCIYLGVISDLVDGPFAPLGVPLTQAQEDYWKAVNASGGLDGWDVVITAENTFDAHYDGAQTVEGATALSGRVAALAQSLGTPQTQAALPIFVENNMVAAPATWWSGWAFADVDSGLILESGAPYCFEAMNGMSAMVDALGAEITWALVAFPGDYGGDYGAGAKIAAAQLGLGDPVSDLLQIPVSAGGDVTEAVTTLLGTQPNLIVVVTGPTEMAQIAGGLFQGGFQTFQILGASPTWNVALTGNADLVPLLQATYWGTTPWGGWDTDSTAHADMRAAADANDRSPHGAYVAGWVWQYPIKALLEQAIASNDLTRANLAAIAAELDGVSYDGALPDRDYTGDPNDHVVRSTIVNRVDPTSSDGLMAVTDATISEIAAAYEFAGPCFVG